MCIYYEIDVIYIHNKFYYELDEKFSDNNELNVITFKNSCFCIDKKVENIDFYRLNFCKMDSINRFLKPFSGYKLADIINLTSKLNINIYDDTEKKKNKQALYNEILLML